MQNPQNSSEQSLSQELNSLMQVRQQLESQPAGQQSSATNHAEQILGNIKGKLSANSQDKQAQASIDEAQKLLKQQSTDPKQLASALERVEQDVRAARPNLAAMDDKDQARAEVQVKQPSADVNVQQPAPQVAVQQPAPDVKVQQPQPKVTVTQPPAQVTVEQPKPKVTVEQAKPDVNVTQAQPKVTVDQPQPKVTVDQPKPDVEVQQAKPDVKVQQQGQADVTVREESQANAEKQNHNATGATPSASSPDTTAAITPDNTVANMGRGLVGKTIYDAAGDEIGDVEDVTMGSGGKVDSALVDVGGFLGIGGKRVAIDASTLNQQGDRLVSSLTNAQVKELPAHKQ
jgi:sporulation protein YlmC with PRC-barrel domain